MKKYHFVSLLMATAATSMGVASIACAGDFDVPSGTMKSALDLYAKQAGVQLIYTDDTIQGIRTQGVKGDLPSDAALTRILAGSGLTVHRHEAGVLATGTFTNVNA